MTGTSTFEPTTSDPFDVVIAGAGFAGLAIAVALSQGMGSAARIALVTRDAADQLSTSDDGRAVALSAASVRMLDALGIWAACAPKAQPVTSIDITDSSLAAGIRPVLLSYANQVGDGEPASHILPNAVLTAALADAARSARGVTIIHNATVAWFVAGPEWMTLALASTPEQQARTALASTPEQQARTALASTPEQQAPRRLTARLLVAADGGRSPLRSKADIKTLRWSYPQTGITVTISHERPHQGKAVQHFLPGGPFAILPLLPGNRSCITWSESDVIARRLLALDDPAFLAEIERRAGGTLGALTLEGRRQSWPLEMMIARAFVAPRFALAGDAAHNVHPIAGQGLNLSLRDVAALAEVIVETHRLGLDIGSPITLSRYEQWRRFDTVSSAAAFDALNRLFSTDGTLRRSLREFGLGLVNRMPALKDRLVTEAAGTSGPRPRLLRGEAI